MKVDFEAYCRNGNWSKNFVENFMILQFKLTALTRRPSINGNINDQIKVL